MAIVVVMVNLKAVIPRRGMIVHQVKTWTCSQHSHCKMINIFVLIIVAESYIFIRPTPCYLHSLNTFEVSVHQNWTVHSVRHVLSSRYPMLVKLTVATAVGNSRSTRCYNDKYIKQITLLDLLSTGQMP